MRRLNFDWLMRRLQLDRLIRTQSDAIGRAIKRNQTQSDAIRRNQTTCVVSSTSPPVLSTGVEAVGTAFDGFDPSGLGLLPLAVIITIACSRASCFFMASAFFRSSTS